jgi:hypothetical protein
VKPELRCESEAGDEADEKPRGFAFDWFELCEVRGATQMGGRQPRVLVMRRHGWPLVCGFRGEACVRRWCLRGVYNCGLNVWGRATFGPKT